MGNNNSRKIFVILLCVVIGIIALIIILRFQGNRSIKPGDPTPTDVNSVVSQYLSAQEDSVGADQQSPTTWLQKIKPITTASWFSHLQPNTAATTGTVPAQYYIAHNNGYIVKANISNCQWVTPPAKNSTKGSVFCDLKDTVINKSTGAEVPAASLPFGWTLVGQQAQHVLSLVNQNGNWLVDNDVISG